MRSAIELSCWKDTEMDVDALWAGLREDFTGDGALRDVYIESTTPADWQEFVEIVRTEPYSTSYERDGEHQPLPARVEDIFADRDATHLLSICLDGLLLNSHFFAPEEIELDVDPRGIKHAGQFGTLCRFLCTVSRHLRRDILLTHENRKTARILTFKV